MQRGRGSRAIGAAALCLLVAGCIAEAVGETEARVVSLTPSASLSLEVLGLREHLVAADPASRELPGFGSLPAASWASAGSYEPTLVLAPKLAGDSLGTAEALRREGVEVIEFDPHGFGDAYALFFELGDQLEASGTTRERVHALADPLARLSAASYGLPRPVVIPVVSLTPPVLAGGHHVLSELIQIAGAESATHGREESQLPLVEAGLLPEQADRVLVALGRPPTDRERAEAAAIAPPGSAVAFVELAESDLSTPWLGDPVRVACEIWGEIHVDRDPPPSCP